MKKSHIYTFFLSLIHFSIFCQKNFQEGFSNYKSGNMEQAIVLFSKAIENNEKTAESYMYRGASKTYLRQYVEALKDIQFSISLDSSNYKPYFYYGRVYFDQGFFSTAIKYYNKALKKNNKDADIYDDRAIANSYEKNYKSAIADEDTAILLNPKNSTYYVNRGFIKLNIKDYNGAINDFNVAQKIDNNQRVFSNRALANASLGKHLEAIKDYNIAIQKMPKAKDLYYLRAKSYIAIGKNNDACVDLLKSKEMGYESAILEYDKLCK